MTSCHRVSALWAYRISVRSRRSIRRASRTPAEGVRAFGDVRIPPMRLPCPVGPNPPPCRRDSSMFPRVRLPDDGRGASELRGFPGICRAGYARSPMDRIGSEPCSNREHGFHFGYQIPDENTDSGWLAAGHVRRPNACPISGSPFTHRIFSPWRPFGIPPRSPKALPILPSSGPFRCRRPSRIRGPPRVIGTSGYKVTEKSAKL